MTKWVSTDYDGCSYITPGKRYEVKRQGDAERSFVIELDNGSEGYCLYEECSHINNGKWTVHELTIEPGKYYRTRDGQKVGPMRESECGDAGGVWGGPTGLYRKDGTFGYGDNCHCHELDIIAEWTEETRDPELTSPYGDGNHPLPPTTGTLRELNVGPGDVVEDTTDGMTFTVSFVSDAAYGNTKWTDGTINKDDRWTLDGMDTWRIISRASTYDPEQEVDQLRNERDALQAVIDGKPVTWGEMTDAEKGELLLDWNDNHARNIQQWNGSEWIGMQTGRFGRVTAYRIRPEPKRDTVTLYHGLDDTAAFTGYKRANDDVIITYTRTDGKPDLDSIKMEALG